MRVRPKNEFFLKAWHLPFDYNTKTIATEPIQFRFMYVDNKVGEFTMSQSLSTFLNTDGTNFIATDSTRVFKRGDKVTLTLETDGVSQYTKRKERAEIVKITVMEDTSLVKSSIRQRKKRYIQILELS